jgi:hypothetical protein
VPSRSVCILIVLAAVSANAHAQEMERLFGDLGVENVLGDSTSAYSKYLVNILVDFKPEESPLRPESADLARQRANRSLH